jgi:hypothetical protein
MLPLLAASDYGLAAAIAVLFLLFLIVGWVIVQGTRAQLYWRKLVDEGDIEAITALVSEELTRWKTMRMPKGLSPAIWHGVQSAELMVVTSDGVRLSASAEGQYAMLGGERREVSGALKEGMRVTAKLADMVLYDIPNVRLPYVQIDIYSTFRDEGGLLQQCVLSTTCERELAEDLAWDELEAEEIVRTFGGRYLLDDRGNPLPINPEETGRSGVPAAFYKED